MDRDQAIKFVHDLLRGMVAKGASDLFLTAGFPPAFKLDGRMTPVSTQSLTPMHTQELARSIMNDRQALEFERSKECNFAINPPGIGRFRVNAFIQQGRVGMVLRTINTSIPRMEDLGLPEAETHRLKAELVLRIDTIVRERKEREFDPTVRLLRELGADPKLAAESPAAQDRLRTTLEFMQTLGAWSDEMLRLSPSTLEKILKLGAQVQRFVRPADGNPNDPVLPLPPPMPPF